MNFSLIIILLMSLIFATTALDEICKLPKKLGTCNKAKKRYYFNQQTGKCEKFEYGGCDKNKNNFKKRKHCEKACKI